MKKGHIGAMRAAILAAGAILTISSAVAQDIAIEPLDLTSDAQAIYPVLRDSTLYFASDQRWDIGKTYFNQRGGYLYKIYRVGIKNRKPNGSARPYFTKAGEGTNMFCLTFDPNGTPYVTENDMSKSAMRGAPMVITHYDGREASKGHTVDTPEGASSGMASISEDGKLMIFASDARGGEGRADLYYCELTRSGWTEPKNLGPVVNTPGTETAPFIHPSGKIFFASDGREDSRGLDIYYTLRNADGSFAKPQKLDDGINSRRDDYGIYYSDDETWGYVTSNRDGKDKIYYFQRTFPTFEDKEELQHMNLCYDLYEASAENYDTTSFQCRWNFGDGASAIGVEVSHCYAGEGTYTIDLSVLDKTSGEEMFSLAQYELEISKPEQVEIVIPEKIRAGEAATFSANTDGLKGFRPREFYWTMGNGDQIKGKSVTTIFSKPGTYRVECGTIDARKTGERHCTWTEVTVE